MKNPKFPHHNFELTMTTLGEGLVVAYDLQSLLAGITTAFEQGLELIVDSNETVIIGSMMQAKVVDPALQETELTPQNPTEVITTGEVLEGDKVDEEDLDKEETPVEEDFGFEEHLPKDGDANESTEQSEVEGLAETGVMVIDFEALYQLDNNKPNRTLVDDMAKVKNINIDRRKFKTVKSIVDEFKKQLNEPDND